MNTPILRRGLRLAVAAVLVTSWQPAAGAAEAEQETLESAVSSPPMEMDDPGTPGRDGIEVNFVGTAVRVGAGRSLESLLDANIGIGDRIQLKLERPYVTEGALGSATQRGFGALELGVKWRAIDHNGLEAAVYPQYQFDDAFTLKDENGDAEESEGRSFYLPLLISENIGRSTTLAANLGYRRNLDSRGDDLNVAFGVGRALGADARVLTEIYSERDEHLLNRQTDVRVGLAFLPFSRWYEKSQFEFPAFASIGHSLGRTESGERSTSFTFGLSIIRKPREG